MTEQDCFEINYKNLASEMDLSHDVQLKKINGRYVFDKARWMWEAWQASANRDCYKLVPVENIKSIYTACNNALDINDIDIYKGLAMAIIDDCEDMIGVINDH